MEGVLRPGARSHDLSGQRFGRWTVLEFSGGYVSGGNAKVRWLCQCDCGVRKAVPAEALRSDQSKSCGCLQKEIASSFMRTHGASKSKLYSVWEGMRARCQNPNTPGFKHYGGRGISVCVEWTDFQVFARDVGEPPGPRYSLEREDVNGNYCPSNVKWATDYEQSRNKRNNIFVLVDGVKMCLKDAAELAGIKYNTVASRMRRYGISGEDALSIPAAGPGEYRAVQQAFTKLQIAYRRPQP